MEISKLKTLTTPNINDIIPILDINGGVSGKPILRKISLQGMFALIDFQGNSNGGSSSGFTIPTIIKTVAESGDYFIGIDSTGTPYKITKSDLLAGLTSASSGGGGGSTGTSNVVLLSHFNGTNDSTTFTDEKGHTYTAFGTPKISTAQFKFNGSSLLLNGSSYLSSANSVDWNFSSSNATI